MKKLLDVDQACHAYCIEYGSTDDNESAAAFHAGAKYAAELVLDLIRRDIDMKMSPLFVAFIHGLGLDNYESELAKPLNQLHNGDEE